MIRLQVSARLQKTAAGMPADVRAAASQALAAVAASFGQSHQHSGLGLRKLGRRSYEVRVTLQWRIVLILDGEILTAYDLMNHDEVRRWVRHQS